MKTTIVTTAMEGAEDGAPALWLEAVPTCPLTLLLAAAIGGASERANEHFHSRQCLTACLSGGVVHNATFRVQIRSLATAF